jgi:hypothetical protein
MKIEAPFFTLRIRHGLSPEQWNEVASALCRIAIDPPQSPRHRRAVAVRAALNLYSGSRYNRAMELERRYRAYLASGWLRERDMETLPEPRSVERVLLHRLARLNEGRALCWRHIIRIAGAVA